MIYKCHKCHLLANVFDYADLPDDNKSCEHDFELVEFPAESRADIRVPEGWSWVREGRTEKNDLYLVGVYWRKAPKHSLESVMLHTMVIRKNTGAANEKDKQS